MQNPHHVMTDLEAEKIDNDCAYNADIADGMIKKHAPEPKQRGGWRIEEYCTLSGAWCWRVTHHPTCSMRYFDTLSEAEAAVDQWEAEHGD